MAGCTLLRSPVRLLLSVATTEIVPAAPAVRATTGMVLALAGALVLVGAALVLSSRRRPVGARA